MGGFREVLVVVAVALAGLFLAAMAAFTPWYGAGSGGAPAPMVGVQ